MTNDQKLDIIIAETARALELDPEDIRRPQRVSRGVRLARRIITTIAVRDARLSLTHIAARLAGADHVKLLFLIYSLKEWRVRDPALDAQVAALELRAAAQLNCSNPHA